MRKYESTIGREAVVDMRGSTGEWCPGLLLPVFMLETGYRAWFHLEDGYRCVHVDTLVGGN